jgi:predicted nucleic acid-binding protein
MGYLIDTCIWIDVERGLLTPKAIASITGEIFGGLAAQIRASGKTVRYRVQDLWLASQAIQHGFRLLTHNKDDFKDIPGLELVVWNKP